MAPLVIEGGTLIDRNGGAPVTDAVVVIHGSRIAAVGTQGPGHRSLIGAAQLRTRPASRSPSPKNP
jgi:hypothetical protein